MLAQMSADTATRVCVLDRKQTSDSSENSIFDRVAEIRSKWSSTERARRALIGMVRRQALLDMVLDRSRCQGENEAA